MKKYLQDKEFLKQLDYDREKETYIRIIALNNDEMPREEIIGQATGGSINVDGSSAVRRTCSLSLVALESDEIITDTYWCYNNKFKLEVGLKNNINKDYPDIIWFEMGIYIITSFNVSKNINSLNISISGKDKMCRLNGEVSGNIMYGTDFGNIDNVTKYVDEDGNDQYLTQKEKLTIKEIIQNAVKIYGQENEHNIIINDLDQYGYELWEYHGDTPMYMFIEYNNNVIGNVVNIAFDGSIKVYDDNDDEYNLEEIPQYYSMNALDDSYNDNATKVSFSSSGSKYYVVAKIEYGQTAGYHQTPLVYSAEELILSAGDTVTGLLDKLKAMLGDYEYFYDLQGRFVFQKKKTHVQELFSPINGDLIIPTMYVSQYEYKFEDENLFTSINNSPNINNVKNDFSVWGTRKSITDQDLPIHARFAIDKKPQQYKSLSITNEEYYFTTIEQENHTLKITDFDKNLFTSGNNITIPNKINNKSITAIGYNIFTSLNINILFIPKTIKKIGRAFRNATIGQVYYEGTEEEWDNIDIIFTETNLKNATKKYKCWGVPEGKNYNISNYDWRELIYQMALDYYAYNQEPDFLLRLQEANPQFIDGKTGYEQYYTDLQGFWRQLYNPMITEQDKEFAEINGFQYYESDDEKPYWNKLIHEDPTQLNFWFDFLDTDGDLSKYSIKNYDKINNRFITNIGTRNKVINDTAVKSIYNRETPKVLIVVSPKDNEPVFDQGFNYTKIQIQEDMEILFSKSRQGNSCIEKVNELINTNTAASEVISITSIPIYYLQPNTRIYIKGYGDYTLDKISYSLNYNGTMNISGNKIIKPIY